MMEENFAEIEILGDRIGLLVAEDRVRDIETIIGKSSAGTRLLESIGYLIIQVFAIP